jgi:hypothetical protein
VAIGREEAEGKIVAFLAVDDGALLLGSFSVIELDHAVYAWSPA